MPTLPSIINPPVGAAVVSYPLPKLPPPLTLNIDPGAVSPMPTLPVLPTTNLSVVPSAVEDAIENLLLETSYPIVHEPAAAPENSNADFVVEYRCVRLFGVVVPMPTLPVLSITNLSVVPSAVEDAIENLLLETSYPIVHEPAAAPETSNADFVAEYRFVRLFGVVVPMPTLPAKYAFPVVVAPPEMVSPPACVPSPMVEEA